MSPKKVSFGEAIALFFKNYFNFNGRSTRSEYWWIVLFIFLVNLVLGFLGGIMGINDDRGNNVFSSLFTLACFVPNLSLTVRRLHDIGKSWLYFLFVLIPLAGPIILIVWMATRSDFDNMWGPCADTLAMGGGYAQPGMYNNNFNNHYNPNQQYNPNGYNQGYDFNNYQNQNYNQGYQNYTDPNNNNYQPYHPDTGYDLEKHDNNNYPPYN